MYIPDEDIICSYCEEPYPTGGMIRSFIEEHIEPAAKKSDMSVTQYLCYFDDDWEIIGDMISCPSCSHNSPW